MAGIPIDRSSSARAAEPGTCTDIEAWLASVGERLLADAHGEVARARWEQALLAPARDFLSRTGKTFRASLTEHGWRLAGGEGEHPPELRVVVELLHAGSLIVDDVEDGGRRRRGEAALHQRYGLPVALNVGNWLYFAPLELLQRLQLPATRELALHRAVVGTLTRGHQGQALDIGLRVFELARIEVPEIVSTATHLKTGALTELAATLGPIAQGTPAHVCEALATFGRRFGVALQMLNDLRGLTEQDAEDLRHGRATWPWAWLADELDDLSYRRMQRRARAAVRHPEQRVELASDLLAATDRAGRAAARLELHGAMAGLRDVFPAEQLSALEQEVARLETAYG